MKITIYELIGMLKDGKAPKKIKINENILNLKICEETYYKYETGGMLTFDYYIENNKLDTIVEVIEEDKKIEKVSECFTSTDNKEIQFLIDNINQLGNKINEIIDKINKMGEK